MTNHPNNIDKKIPQNILDLHKLQRWNEKPHKTVSVFVLPKFIGHSV